MILQIDPRWHNPAIQQYGCHLLAECFLINRFNVPMSIEIIEQAISALQMVVAPNGKPAIDTRMTINDPDALVKHFGLLYSSWARIEGPGYLCKPWEQELQEWRRAGVNFSHWVAGDGKGNVAYDPEGYSKSVASGQILRQKIFTIYR
jgi:hypothetical protein